MARTGLKVSDKSWDNRWKGDEGFKIWMQFEGNTEGESGSGSQSKLRKTSPKLGMGTIGGSRFEEDIDRWNDLECCAIRRGTRRNVLLSNSFANNQQLFDELMRVH